MTPAMPANPAALPASFPTVAEALRQALEFHRDGRLIDAERLYRAILDAEPAQPDALHNMGVLQMQGINPAAALSWFHAALEAQPQNRQCWLSYAEALLEAGQAEDARLVISTGRGAGLDGEDADLLEARIIGACMK